jgi:phosphoadenylyl-sulfate reductase (thioredoxin)
VPQSAAAEIDGGLDDSASRAPDRGTFPATASSDAIAPAELVAASRRLERASPLEVLNWAAGRFAPRIVFATGFGAEGCVLIDLIGRHRLAIDVFTLDTGLLFPETLDLWRRLEGRYGLTIRAVRPALTVEEQAGAHGERLWARDADRCCELRKVRPLRAALAGSDAWVTAIRRDQTADRAAAAVVERDPRFGLVKVSPLAGWSAADVAAHLAEHDVPTNPLHALGYPSVGCWPCTSPVAAGEDPRAGRWRGQAKTECGLHLRRTSPLLVLSDPSANASQGGIST